MWLVNNDEANIPLKLLSANIKVLRLSKAFANTSSANIKFWKTQLYKMIQSGGILDALLEGLAKGLFVTGLEQTKIAIKRG